MELTTQQAVYLAALLHDIGKFWQRSVRSRKALSQSTLSMAGSICPTAKAGYATHIHALFTSEFFENHQHIFPGEFDYGGRKFQLGNLSARHHKRNLGSLERIIQYADNLSSGHDRRQNSEDDSNDTTYKYKKIPLLNPFDRVYRIRLADEKSYYPFKKLKADETIFASRDIDPITDKQDLYKVLWDEFEQEVGNLPKGSFSAQATTLLSLLKKYTWCIPSATNTMPDISLYDHLKTTAAIASCLFDSTQLDEFGPLPETFDGLKEETKKRFVLLVGDFSGIQKFIYQLSSKGAAKTLKGRSFYLSLLQDAVIREIKQVLGVEDAHILMSSGGSFQLLLPNDEEKLCEVRTFITEVNKSLRKKYGGAIYLATGAKPFAAGRLMDDNGYGILVSKVYQLIEEDKSHKFADAISSDFFKPGPTAGTGSDQICHVTGLDLQRDEAKKEGDLIVSKSVREQIRLGKWLKNAKYIVKLKKAFDEIDDRKEIAPLSEYGDPTQGIVYRFYKDNERDKSEIRNMIDSDQFIEVVSLNDTDFMLFSSPEQSVAHSFMFYGAAWTPDEVDGKPVEFTDIAEDGANNLMAVLCLDVDNLSRLFQEGFSVKDGIGDCMGSISRYSNMSEKLKLFFAGYINYLIEKVLQDSGILDETLLSSTFDGAKSPNQYIFPVYAGGDDVFIICRWDLAPQLAERICNDFKKFTNGHSDMSLSGGTSMVHGKYPIHKAAQEAKAAEHKAKTFTVFGSPIQKDAFCMFGQAMSWRDYRLARSYIRQIIAWQNGMESRAILGFLRNLYSEYETSHHYGRWRWRSAYQLKRMGKRYKIEEDMVRYASCLFTGDYNNQKIKRAEILTENGEQKTQRNPELVDLTGFAIRWVQSLTRNKS